MDGWMNRYERIDEWMDGCVDECTIDKLNTKLCKQITTNGNDQMHNIYTKSSVSSTSINVTYH